MSKHQHSSHHHEPFIEIHKGKPDSAEFQALNYVFHGLVKRDLDAEVIPRDLWGHPVNRLRYSIFSWQRVTLLERTHMRR